MRKTMEVACVGELATGMAANRHACASPSMPSYEAQSTGLAAMLAWFFRQGWQPFPLPGTGCRSTRRPADDAHVQAKLSGSAIGEIMFKRVVNGAEGQVVPGHIVLGE